MNAWNVPSIVRSAPAIATIRKAMDEPTDELVADAFREVVKRSVDTRLQPAIPRIDLQLEGLQI